MAAVTVTQKIDAPVDQVFGAFIDLDRWAERISGIVRVEKLTDGPAGLGTRFRETRIMFKREATEEMEFSEFEPNQSYTLTCESCGARYETVHQFRYDGDGTVVEMTMSIQPISFMAKLMSPLGRLMSGSLKKCLEKDLAEIKQAIEGDR